jgi:benzoate-CoA ligase family protein
MLDNPGIREVEEVEIQTKEPRLLFDVPDTFNMATTLVDRHVEEGRGDRVAIYFDDERITYRDLLRRVNRAGNLLRDQGVRIEERVVLLMADRPEFVEVYVGAMKIGAVPVPINVLSTSDQIIYYLRDSRATAIVIDAELLPRLREVRAECRYLRTVLVRGEANLESGELSYDQAIAAASEELEPEPTHKDDASYWLYSSGTTGGPKGTVHLHRDMVYCTGTWMENVSHPTSADINYSASKLPFSYGLVNGLYQPLLSGTAVVLVAQPSNPQVIAQTINRYRPTIFFSVPGLYNQILREHEAGNLQIDLSSLRVCVSAGEALPEAIYNRWLERFGTEILDGIGSTEFGYIYIQNLPGKAKPGSSGQLLPGYEAKIMDEDGREVEPGGSGELYIQSPSFAAYYWQKRERSKDTFRGPWLKTGDRYTRDTEGYFYYEARGDDMFKSNGQWVSPIEVENVLLRHECVAEAAVVAYEDADGLVKPSAYVVLKAGYTGDEALAETLKAHCLQQLAAYKHPRVIHFTTELPKTATGKIQRYRLRG